MDNSHLILLKHYQKHQGGSNNLTGGSNNLTGGLPWYYYLWPGNWFTSKKKISSQPVDEVNNNNSSQEYLLFPKKKKKHNKIKNLFKYKKNIDLPSLVKLDVKLYNPLSNGGYSRNIIPVIDNEYNLGNHNFKNNDPESNVKIDFTIIKSMDKILFGAGTFTAVYKIKDNNNTINDPNVKDNIYILRIVKKDNYNIHMYDDPKIHKEYKLFNKYLPRIYYYGNFITSKNFTFNYTITKLYNDFPVINNRVIIPKTLSNIDKFEFLYNNIVMLNDLSKYNYTHFDYKIENVGFEIENNKISVILIDYDKSTLQELSEDNPNFEFDNNNNVTALLNTGVTHFPEWLSNRDNPEPFYFNYKLPIYKFHKFAVVGLFYLILDLDIQFKIEKLQLYNLPSYDILLDQYKFEDNILLNNLSNTDAFHLYNSNYDVIPTYDLLLEILSPIINNKEMYLL
jgi:hypothetical protein